MVFLYHLNFHVQISVTYIFYLQDQRILELMMMKGEGEISANRDRFVADLAWEEQRKLEEEVKVRTEMKRRQMLAEENRIRDMKKVGKQDEIKSKHCWCFRLEWKNVLWYNCLAIHSRLFSVSFSYKFFIKHNPMAWLVSICQISFSKIHDKFFTFKMEADITMPTNLYLS